MRISPSEKQEIIRIVERSELGVNRTLKELDIHKSTFYKWYRIYTEKGIDGLLPQKRTRRLDRLNELFTPIWIGFRHSVRSDFTGFAIAALIAWKLTVNKVINNAPEPARAKIHHDKAARYW